MVLFVMERGLLIGLVLLLVVMSLGVFLELNHLYSIPGKLFTSSNVSYPSYSWSSINASLSRFNSYNEISYYFGNVTPSSWVQPLMFGLTTTEATVTTPLAARVAKGGEVPYSTTNVQVSGIDESDIVKTDGSYVYLVSGQSIKIVRVYPLNMSGLTATIVFGKNLYPRGLLLWNNTLIVFAVTHGYPIPLYASAVTKTETTTLIESGVRHVERDETIILTYDISNRNKPYLTGEHNVTGYFITARLVNNTVIMVSQEPVYRIYRFYMETGNPASIAPLLDNKPVAPRNIYYSPGSPPSSYANIVSLKLRENIINATSILCPPVSRVYVSHEMIYVFATTWVWNRFLRPLDLVPIVKHYLDAQTNRLIDEILNTTSISPRLREQLVYNIISEKVGELDPQSLRALKKEVVEKASSYIGGYNGPRTQVYAVSLYDGKPVSTGAVEGQVLDQFAIDSYKGMLRVATTAYVISGFNTYDFFPFVYPLTKTVNNIYIMNSTSLAPIGSLEGVSPGEGVYSARYMGDILYLVTYRRVDPLYAIDLSDPGNPRILGYTKFPGYSEYLHPINNSILIGIGYATDAQGRINGVKVSLYDVENPLDIREISSITLPFIGYSQVMYDYHAFLINPYKNYIGFPISYYDGKKGGIIGLAEIIGLDNGRLYKMLSIEHRGIQRILYVGDYIITVSPDLLKITASQNNQVSIPLK